MRVRRFDSGPTSAKPDTASCGLLRARCEQIVAAAQEQDGFAQKRCAAVIETFARDFDVPVTTALVRQMGNDADRVPRAFRNPRQLEVCNGLELPVINLGSRPRCPGGPARLRDRFQVARIL